MGVRWSLTLVETRLFQPCNIVDWSQLGSAWFCTVWLKFMPLLDLPGSWDCNDFAQGVARGSQAWKKSLVMAMETFKSQQLCQMCFI